MLEPASVFATIGYGDGLRLELEGAIFFLLQPAWQRVTMGGARCWNRQGHELRRAAGHAGTSKVVCCNGPADNHAGTGKAASCNQRGTMLESMQEIKLLSREPLFKFPYRSPTLQFACIFRTKITAAMIHYLYIGPKIYESGKRNTLQYP